MNKIRTILAFLDGKKTIILGVVASTLAYLSAKHFIDADTSAYIDTVMTIIFGGAAIRTTQLRPKLEN